MPSCYESFFKKVKSMNTIIEEGYPKLEFIKTYTYLDSIHNGIAKSSLNILMGGTGSGKSMVALHMASILSRDNKVLYISLENNLATDMARYEKMPKEYEVNGDNLHFFSLQESNIDLEDIKLTIYNTIEKGKYDLIFIDAPEILLASGEDGASLFKIGNDFAKDLHQKLKKSKTAVIMTWQMTREGISESLDKVTAASTSMSIAIARYAECQWAVGKIKTKEETDWRVKVIKCRHECNWDNAEFSILDSKGINLVYMNLVENLVNFSKNPTKYKK